MPPEPPPAPAPAPALRFADPAAAGPGPCVRLRVAPSKAAAPVDLYAPVFLVSAASRVLAGLMEDVEGSEGAEAAAAPGAAGPSGAAKAQRRGGGRAAGAAARAGGGAAGGAAVPLMTIPLAGDDPAVWDEALGLLHPAGGTHVTGDNAARLLELADKYDMPGVRGARVGWRMSRKDLGVAAGRLAAAGG
jgi:hypothetical protein